MSLSSLLAPASLTQLIRRTWGRKTTIGTSHQKEIVIPWPCMLAPGKWTNEIDVPRKCSGKKR